jgi:hypothetical protein
MQAIEHVSEQRHHAYLPFHPDDKHFAQPPSEASSPMNSELSRPASGSEDETATTDTEMVPMEA